MGRPALALLLLVASIASSVVSARAANSEEITRAATVLITGLLGGAQATGAGVIVKAEPSALTILTARHVADLSNLTILTYDGRRLQRADAIAVPGYDLCIIRAVMPLRSATYPSERPGFALAAPPLALSNYRSVPLASAVEPDMAVHIWGHGSDAGFGVAPGQVIDLNPSFPDGPANGRFAIRCETCVAGMSGSGVFSGNGTLIGILSAAWKSTSGEVRMIEVEPLDPARAALR